MTAPNYKTIETIVQTHLESKQLSISIPKKDIQFTGIFTATKGDKDIAAVVESLEGALAKISANEALRNYRCKLGNIVMSWDFTPREVFTSGYLVLSFSLPP